MQVAVSCRQRRPNEAALPLGSENVCRDSGRRNEPVQAAGVRIAHPARLKTRGTTWLEGHAGRASH
jgi:hypothetical protein